MKLPGLVPPPSAQNVELQSRELLLGIIKRQNKQLLGMFVVIGAMALALSALLPLKEVRPFVVRDNPKTGEVSVPPQTAVTQFTPSQDNIMFFVRRWVVAAFSIQPQLTTTSYQPLALSGLRGKNAIAQYEAMRASDKALERMSIDPTLVREVEILSISPVAGSERGVVANLLLRTTFKGQITEERKLLTLYYEILPPKSEDDRRVHPIGLYIVDFKLADNK